MPEIRVDGKIRSKQRPRFYNGRAITPKQTIAYEDYIKWLWTSKHDTMIHADTPIKISVIAYFGIPKSYSKKKKEACYTHKLKPTKKPDTDNILKIVCDALNGIAYYDDKQIVEATVKKLYSVDEKEYLTIEVEVIE